MKLLIFLGAFISITSFATIEIYFTKTHPQYGKITVEGVNYSDASYKDLEKLFNMWATGKITTEIFDTIADKYSARRRGGPALTKNVLPQNIIFPSAITFGQVGKIYTGGVTGQVERGGEFPVEVDLTALQNDPNVHYRWRFVRIDQPGNEKLDATDSIIKMFLQKLSDGKVVDEALLGQWKNETGNIIDIRSPKKVIWHPQLDEQLSGIGVSPAYCEKLKQEILVRLNDEKTIFLYMFPKPFETLALPEKFEFPPIVEVGLAVIALANPKDEEAARQALRKSKLEVELFAKQVRDSIPLMVSRVMLLKTEQEKAILSGTGDCGKRLKDLNSK